MKQTLFGLYDDLEIERSLAAMEPDSHGLTVLPFWFGERSTGWSASAQGSVLGVTARNKPGEILRAATEARCYWFARLADGVGSAPPISQHLGNGNALVSSVAWKANVADA